MLTSFKDGNEMTEIDERLAYRTAAARYMAAWRDESTASAEEKEAALDGLIKADVWCGGCDRE